MNQYHKTDLGIESLKQRSMNLSARQRRLLLLIGTDDFDLLPEQFKRRLAPPELLEQLLDLGLISCTTLTDSQTTLSTATLNTEIESNLSLSADTTVKEKLAESITLTSTSASIATQTSSQLKTSQNEIQHIDVEILSFEEIKHLMAQLLQNNCGLMAKQLITRILEATDLRSLKLCQIQWTTSLQESRIAPQELNRYLYQINSSLQKLLS